MGKFKNFIEEQKTDLRALLFNYTFTIIAVAILSIVLCIDFEMDGSTDFIYNTEIFIAVFAVGAFFIETFFVNKNQEKNWGKLTVFYVVNAGVSAIWTILVHYSENIANKLDDPDIFYLNISKLFGVYIVGLMAVTVYKLVKKSGLKLDIYLARAIFGLLKVWGLFFVVYLALCLLLSIFESLIMEIDYWDILDNMTILIIGFVCFPYSLLMISDTSEENSKFTKGLISYVLMPAVIIAFLIVYLYILKIIVGWDMPSNEVFDICLMVFILGGPVWFMSHGFLREKVASKGDQLGLYGNIVKNMRYAYAPLIILEMVAIGIRLYNYGLTTERYLAIVAIVFQIVYVLWDVIGKVVKRELREEGLVLVGLGIFAFIMLFPGLNMDKLPAELQIARFEEALADEDYVTAGAAYEYLKYCEYGDEYIDEKFTIEDKKALELLFYDYVDEDDDYKYEEYIRRYVSYNDKKMGINIEGYTNIYPLEFDGDYDTIYTEKELSAMTISYGDGAFQVANVDINSLVKESTKKADMADEDNYSQTMPYKYIKLGNNCCVVIESIDFRYNMYTGEVSNLNFEGYILTNEGGHNGQ